MTTSEAQTTVEFVQEWMMSNDHEPDQWTHDFAAAIDARRNAEVIPAEIADHVRAIGRVEWGQTHAHDAAGHGAHVAESVRLTAANFAQTGNQHMHGLWLEGQDVVLCHTGTSPNAPKTTQALVGAWNWLLGQVST